jgi:hypothetical protein
VAKATRAAQAADGLVIAAYLSVAPAGRFLQLHLPGVAPESEGRGEVEGFSEGSERRLVKLLNGLRREAALPVMVTLTFPAEVEVTAFDAKACKLAWSKRMRREYGKRWAHIWRLEAHPELSRALGRMHPHFHLLAWNAFYDFTKVSQLWTEVVWAVLKLDECLVDDGGRSVKEKHLAAGTSCERVRKWAGVIYCAKTYIAKPEEYPVGKAGRLWGYFNRRCLPMAAVVRIPLTHQQAIYARRAVEEWMRERKIESEHLICTFFCDDPVAFAARLGVKM